ncbi:MAG: MFS transporter [Chloroflexi bacterium]|nr:MFS transporter [Chloroflexota bacterium]
MTYNSPVNSYLALIRRRPAFRRLWLASVVSFAGDWFNTIASVIIVTRYSESGLAVGALFLARTLPQFLLGPIAGVVADRFNRKHVMIASDVLRAAIVLSFLFVDRPERLWMIYALTVAQFVLSTFFQPANAAILPSLVHQDELVTGNVISSITWSAMLALGAALGGAVAALFGAGAALVLDSLSYLISALLVVGIQSPALVPPESSKSSGWTDLLEGFAYVRANAHARMLALVKALGQVGTGDIIIATFARRIFVIGRESAGSLGLLYAAAGLGAVLGPVLGRYLHDESPAGLRRRILDGFWIMPLGWVVMAWAPNIWVAMFGLLLNLMGGSANWTFSSVLIQTQVPDRYLGRVFALDFALFTLASAASLWLFGWLLDRWLLDPRTILYGVAALSLIPVAIWAAYLRRTVAQQAK